MSIVTCTSVPDVFGEPSFLTESNLTRRQIGKESQRLLDLMTKHLLNVEIPGMLNCSLVGGVVRDQLVAQYAMDEFMKELEEYGVWTDPWSTTLCKKHPKRRLKPKDIDVHAEVENLSDCPEVAASLGSALCKSVNGEIAAGCNLRCYHVKELDYIACKSEYQRDQVRVFRLHLCFTFPSSVIPSPTDRPHQISFKLDVIMTTGAVETMLNECSFLSCDAVYMDREHMIKHRDRRLPTREIPPKKTAMSVKESVSASIQLNKYLQQVSQSTTHVYPVAFLVEKWEANVESFANMVNRLIYRMWMGWKITNITLKLVPREGANTALSWSPEQVSGMPRSRIVHINTGWIHDMEEDCYVELSNGTLIDTRTFLFNLENILVQCDNYRGSKSTFKVCCPRTRELLPLVDFDSTF